MKVLHVLSLMVSMAAIPCFAQNATITPVNPPPLPADRKHEHREELLKKLEGMTPDQRQQFLQNHPKLEKFVSNHPEFAQKIASGSAAGAGIKDPGHPRVNEVNRREQNQQDRIAQGVKSGSLTPQEAANLEKGESKIQQQEKADLQKNNGHLTAAEQDKLNKELNKESKRIHRKKNN